jgi:hypothetical protein
MRLKSLITHVQTYAAIVMVALGPYVCLAFAKGHNLPKTTVTVRAVTEDDPLRTALDNERRKFALLRYLMMTSAIDQKADNVWYQQETSHL